MKIWDAIDNRRTVHHFEPNVEIPQSILQQSLEFALMAPNHKYTFPWSFIRVGSETRERLVELAEEFARAKDPKVTPDKLARIREKVAYPAELIVFCCNKSTDEKVFWEDYASVACAIQNFSLSMAGHGYQCKWSTGRLSSDEKTYDLLQVDQNKKIIAGFVWAGKPSQIPGARRRPNLDTCLTETP